MREHRTYFSWLVALSHVPRFPDPDDRLVLEPGCDWCPALVDSRERISWGVGARDAALVIVGEAPATGDPDAERWQGGNHTGMAYTARHSGRRIRELFENLGYDPGELYFTNAVKCCPTDAGGSVREPTAAEREHCQEHLLAELDAVDPDCVVATGKHATTTLLSVDDKTLDSFLKTVLEPIDVDGLPPVLPILHPSYQDVWIGRLGHTPESYRRAIEETLAEL